MKPEDADDKAAGRKVGFLLVLAIMALAFVVEKARADAAESTHTHVVKGIP